MNLKLLFVIVAFLFMQMLHAQLTLEVGEAIFGSLTDITYEASALQLIAGITLDLYHRKLLVPMPKDRKQVHRTCKWFSIYLYALIIVQVAFIAFGSPFPVVINKFIIRIVASGFNSFIIIYMLVNMNLPKPTRPRDPEAGKTRQPKGPATPPAPETVLAEEE